MQFSQTLRARWRAAPHSSGSTPWLAQGEAACGRAFVCETRAPSFFQVSDGRIHFRRHFCKQSSTSVRAVIRDEVLAESRQCLQEWPLPREIHVRSEFLARAHSNRNPGPAPSIGPCGHKCTASRKTRPGLRAPGGRLTFTSTIDPSAFEAACRLPGEF